MAGDGNHPLKQSHYDTDTLQEYVLGQLLPDQEEAIRQHLAGCPLCRAEVSRIRAFCHRISNGLARELDGATPGPRLSFDRIAPEWRKPPRRVTLAYRAQRLVPSACSLLLVGAFLVAFLLLLPAGDSAALRGLELARDYQGPPAVIAAATDDGLVVVRLGEQLEVTARLSYVTDPRNLQFSADGRWLALQDGHVLHIMEARDGGVHVRYTLHGPAGWAWSPDGQSLAYTDGGGQLAVFDTATHASRLLVPAEESVWGTPVWSADGHQIAYAVAIPRLVTDSARLRQGVWRVEPATGYRVELARNTTPGDTLIVPVAWARGDTALLAWDVNAGVAGIPAQLYWIDAAAHGVEPVAGFVQASGTDLAWPVSAQGMALLVSDERLTVLDLAEGMLQRILEPLPWPQTVAWAPNGAWLAFTVAGAAEGQGLYALALSERELRPIALPAGATEKAVIWAGAEHLFVVRQARDSSASELWLVALTRGEPPQRIMASVRLPQAGQYNGWRWQDVIAAQVITGER